MHDLSAVIERASHVTLDRLIEKFQAGVRTPSVNPGVPGGTGEAAFQDVFAGELDALGCRIERWEPDSDELAARYPTRRILMTKARFDGRPNVAGWLPAAHPSTDGHAHVILNSHADTVGPGDTTAWRHPPFEGALTDGRIVGLGSVDAKGCLYTFLGAALILKTTGILLQEPVVIQSVVDEEFGGAGALACLARGHRATAALVGEPTGLMVCPGSRGSSHLRLRIRGRGAHPGEGWLGVNAVHMAWRYVQALERLRDKLDRTQMHPLWAPLPMGHVWNLLSINSEPQVRAVPSWCDLEYSIGVIGTETWDDMRARVGAAIETVTAADPWLADHPPELHWSEWVIEPAVADPEHPAVRIMAAAGSHLDENPVRVQALSAGTDGRHLSNIGGIPVINFGPGEMFRGHSPDEALPVDQLRRAAAWVALFLTRYCGVARGPA